MGSGAYAAKLSLYRVDHIEITQGKANLLGNLFPAGICLRPIGTIEGQVVGPVVNLEHLKIKQRQPVDRNDLRSLLPMRTNGGLKNIKWVYSGVASFS